MHRHLMVVTARPKETLRPAKVIVLERRARRASRRRGTSGIVRVRPREGTTGRPFCTTNRRLLVRMWRNRHTHRSQKPAGSAHEGSTPSLRTEPTTPAHTDTGLTDESRFSCASSCGHDAEAASSQQRV